VLFFLAVFGGALGVPVVFGVEATSFFSADTFFDLSLGVSPTVIDADSSSSWVVVAAGTTAAFFAPRFGTDVFSTVSETSKAALFARSRAGTATFTAVAVALAAVVVVFAAVVVALAAGVFVVVVAFTAGFARVRGAGFLAGAISSSDSDDEGTSKISFSFAGFGGGASDVVADFPFLVVRVVVAGGGAISVSGVFFFVVADFAGGFLVVVFTGTFAAVDAGVERVLARSGEATAMVSPSSSAFAARRVRFGAVGAAGACALRLGGIVW
jgi:hypothetical protein